MKDIKQNKNSSVIRFLSFLTAFVVLVFSISLPAFAYTDTSINSVDFSNQPIGYGNPPTFADLPDASFTYNGTVYKPYIVSSAEVIGYFFLVQSSSTTYGRYYAVPSQYGNTLKGNAVSSGGTYGSVNINTLDSTTQLYHNPNNSISSSTLSNIYVPIFSSLADGLAAVRDWINNPPATTTPHQLSLSVPAGNALYIDVTGVSTVRASLSMTSEVAHPQSWRSNQYYGFAASYPSSIAGNPSGSTVIPWTGYGDKTILNRYKSFSWSLTSVGGSNYLFICNPYATIDEYDQSFNPTIYITVEEAVGYKFYQLTGGISEDGTIGQQSDGTTATGTYDEQSQTWVTTNDQTGQPWTPSEGGGNIITQNSINSWLQTISTQIGNFFSGAIGAVTTLVSAGSDFIHQLSSLYSWLPAPVYAVLTSALILVITIGVIKVFI